MFDAALDARRPRNALRPTSGLSADAPVDRRDSAFAAIEGRAVGLLERNPWVPILDFDASIVGAVMANGGLVLTLQLNDPVSFTDTDRIAVLWDDQTLADGPKTVIQGKKVVITIPSVKGDRLSVWCTSMLVANIVDTQPLSQLANVNKNVAAGNAASDAQPSAFGDWVTKFFQAQTMGAVGVLVVGGVLVYVFRKEIFSAAV